MCQQRLNTEAVLVKGAITRSTLLSHPLSEGDEQRGILMRFTGGGQQTRAAQMVEKQPVASEQV
jgi:hypothetical protein